MPYRSRPLRFPLYRLIAVVLAFSVAFLCLGQVVMEHFYGYSMIPAESPATHDAILNAAIISGILSLFFGFLLLRIMTDRRAISTDRRRNQVDIDFPDRRSGIDRRTGLPSK